MMSQLENELDVTRQELSEVKAELFQKKKEHDKLATRLLSEMTR